MQRILFVVLISCISINECLSLSDPLRIISQRTILLSSGIYGTAESPTESPLEKHISLITINRNLKIALYFSLAALFILVFAAFYWRKKALLGARVKVEVKEAEESVRPIVLNEVDPEIALLRDALNEERAKVVRHEVQKKELLAYIDELKALHGSSEVKHKTIQIQRIFAEQKTEDIVSKVENTAKVLYPELVEAVQKRYPELNKLELQYCMMLTLGYNLDEVMSVLGRSEKAIKSLRYRIRKKMKLENPQSLKRFIGEMNVYLTENQ